MICKSSKALKTGKTLIKSTRTRMNSALFVGNAFLDLYASLLQISPY